MRPSLLPASGTSLALGLVALAALSGPALRAQPSVLYELASPAPEVVGRFGWAVAALADQNGDGVGDFVVGTGEAAGALNAGRAYVFSGADGALLHTLASPNPEPEGDFGLTVAGLGGAQPDVLVGALNEDVGAAEGAGRAYVFRDGALAFTLTEPTPQEGGTFGIGVADAGDVNGDGLHDYLVGAPAEGDPGGAYVFDGATGALLHALVPPAPLPSFGYAVASVGDLDGDGAPEHLVGAPFGNGGGVSGSGQALLFDGATGTYQATLASPTPEVFGFFGFPVVGLGTFDGDPYLAVGATRENPGGEIAAGRAHVYRGSGDGFALHATLVSPNAEMGGLFGVSLSGLSGPGAAAFGGESPFALLAGASQEDVGGQEGAGRAYLFRLDGTLAATFEPQAPELFGNFGRGVTGLGDLDGDGSGEVAIGAPFESPGGVEGSGRVSVWTLAGVVASEPGAEGPAALALHAPVPNPARGAVRLAFALDAPGPVRLAVYDALGREVAVLVDAVLGAGRHEAVLDGAGLPAGVYLVRLDAGGRPLTRRLTLVR